MILRARLHYGPPLFGYIFALAMVAVTGAARLAWMATGESRAPFLLFYPAVALTSFLAGVGPGLFAIVAGAAFGASFFSTFPPPGSWVALSVLGPFFVAGFAHLREMREQHAATARECARFRFISDHVSDWIFLTDDSGRIELANRTASLRFGLDGADLTGQPIDELASSPERSAFRGLVEDCARTGTSSGEILLSPREGSPVYAGIGCTAVRLEGKVVIHVAARDITERKLLDRQLREARQWESLRVLAGGLAHDFNNRLTAIMGNAMMAREELAGHPATAMLENIEEAGQRTAHLVQLMLATSGYRSLHAEPVRLDRILRNVLESGAFPGHVRLEADAPETGYLGDSLSFETLLQSLIANAAEAYGESPGEVKICLHPDSAPGPDAGSFEEGDTGSGKCVGIVVEDSGGGMTREVLERAFDPFFTTKFMGRGLGLPAVRGIVRAYSGKLRLRTREGEGTCVEVWLPHPD